MEAIIVRDFVFWRSLGGIRRFDFVRQAISAVSYIHEKGYVHRDIKTENFLHTSFQKFRNFQAFVKNEIA